MTDNEECDVTIATDNMTATNEPLGDVARLRMELDAVEQAWREYQQTTDNSINRFESIERQRWVILYEVLKNGLPRKLHALFDAYDAVTAELAETKATIAKIADVMDNSKAGFRLVAVDKVLVEYNQSDKL